MTKFNILRQVYTEIPNIVWKLFATNVDNIVRVHDYTGDNICIHIVCYSELVHLFGLLSTEKEETLARRAVLLIDQ